MGGMRIYGFKINKAKTAGFWLFEKNLESAMIMLLPICKQTIFHFLFMHLLLVWSWTSPVCRLNFLCTFSCHSVYLMSSKNMLATSLFNSKSSKLLRKVLPCHAPERGSSVKGHGAWQVRWQVPTYPRWQEGLFYECEVAAQHDTSFAPNLIGPRERMYRTQKVNGHWNSIQYWSILNEGFNGSNFYS